MAQVHVDVGSTKPKRGLFHRTVRWADRALLGIVMGFAAFAIERVVLRGSRRAQQAAELEP